MCQTASRDGKRASPFSDKDKVTANCLGPMETAEIFIVDGALYLAEYPGHWPPHPVCSGAPCFSSYLMAVNGRRGVL